MKTDLASGGRCVGADHREQRPALRVAPGGQHRAHAGIGAQHRLRCNSIRGADDDLHSVGGTGPRTPTTRIPATQAQLDLDQLLSGASGLSALVLATPGASTGSSADPDDHHDSPLEHRLSSASAGGPAPRQHQALDPHHRAPHSRGV